MESGNDSLDMTAPSKQRKHIWLKIPIIIVATIILIFGIIVLGYHTFLPAKYILMTAGYSSTVKSYKMLDKNLDLYEKRFEPFVESTIQKETKMGLSLDKSLFGQAISGSLLSDLIPDDSSDEIIKAINNISLKYDFATDYKNKKFTSRLSLNYLLNPILTTRLSLDDTRFYIGIDELTNKTLVGDLKDFKTLSKFSPDIPDEGLEALEAMNPWLHVRATEEIRIDRKDLKNLMFNYSKEIVHSIDDNDMTINRGVPTEVLGKTEKCQEITISLDGEGQKKSAMTIVNLLKTDDSFYNLTFANMDKYFSILEESSYIGKLISKSGIRDKLSKAEYMDLLSEMEKIIEASEDPGELKIKIYIDGLDIVKYIVSYKGDADSEDTLFTLEQRIKGQSFDFKYTNGCENAKTVFAIKHDYDKANDLNDIVIKFDGAEDISDNPIKFSIAFNSDEEIASKKEIKHKINLDLSLEITTPGGIEKNTAKLSFDGDKLRNADNLITESDYKGTLTMSTPTLSFNNTEIGFYFKTESEYGNEVTIPESDEVIDIKTATEEDFGWLTEEIITNIGALSKLTGAF
ncbi:MAG: hypothetical protein ACOYIF_04630 [Acetivibrionales bacterium]|jgi:hypothetical protein